MISRSQEENTMTMRGGTFMKERPLSVSPKTSADDPPAANQPLGGGDLGKNSNAKPDERVPEGGRTDGEVTVPGKPDGEVDTRA
jgi:hypothetical protein